jgi:hypothetical protein
MKKLMFVLVVFFSLTSCGGRNFNMRVCSGDGIAYTETWIECDSFQMVSRNEAFIWVDGQKMKIVGDRGIKPETN